VATLGNGREYRQPGNNGRTPALYFFRFVDGKIVEFDGLFDELGYLKQLGATITPPASKSVNA
jgi:hypothetical protein